MLYLEPNAYFTIQQLEGGPNPLPLKSGFSLDTKYRAIGGFNMSETAEMYFMFANDRDEIWFISNRHVRFAGIFKSREARI
jgi:hypothetical protein